MYILKFVLKMVIRKYSYLIDKYVKYYLYKYDLYHQPNKLNI